MPDSIRLSLGTAMQLELVEGQKSSMYTTAFLMTYLNGKCDANCAFCPQSSSSSSSTKLLSRISWPEVEMDAFLEAFGKQMDLFNRVCIQSLKYSDAVDDVISILSEVRSLSSLPISVSIHPLTRKDMIRLRDAGASNIGIAFDACTPELFEVIKGSERGSPYRWAKHLQAIEEALDVFGLGRVTTHLMVGLGETEEEAINFLLQMKHLGVSVGLFAFTNIRGTSLESHASPSLATYRRIQAIKYLILRGHIDPKQMRFDRQGRASLDIDSALLEDMLSSGHAFQTSGCPGCNRPFYNERPRGPMYNYPRALSDEEVRQAIEIAELVR
ncbi:MAG: radical SAM protein [Candidatus Hodarchaeota archaeon]